MEYCKKGSLERAVSLGKFIRLEDRQHEMVRQRRGWLHAVSVCCYPISCSALLSKHWQELASMIQCCYFFSILCGWLLTTMADTTAKRMQYHMLRLPVCAAAAVLYGLVP
jgi:hypothetical protein